MKLGAFRVAHDVAAGHYRRAGVRRQHACQHPQRGRLSRAIRPDQAENFSSVHFEAELVDGAQFAKCLVQRGNHDGGRQTHGVLATSD
jgi:hypothetical protein